VDEVGDRRLAGGPSEGLGLREREYQPLETSGLIDLGPNELERQIDWP
jgi:hypothetical protein